MCPLRLKNLVKKQHRYMKEVGSGAKGEPRKKQTPSATPEPHPPHSSMRARTEERSLNGGLPAEGKTEQQSRSTATAEAAAIFFSVFAAAFNREAAQMLSIIKAISCHRHLDRLLLYVRARACACVFLKEVIQEALPTLTVKEQSTK